MKSAPPKQYLAWQDRPAAFFFAATWQVHIGVAVLLGVAAVYTTREIWQVGVASTADMLMGIYRVFELREAITLGVLYPRIGQNLNFGYGAPLFQFYPPLASYGALAFHALGLGLIDAGKAMFVLSIFAGALGVYFFAYSLYARVAAALLSAAAYLYAPYLLLVVFERGAAAESLALAITPWLFWTFYRLLAREGWRPPLVAGATLALLVLAHNITALFVLPAVLLFTLVLAVSRGQVARVLYLLAATLVGLGLSAFYWLPALFEVKYTLTEARMLFGATEVAANLAQWQELLHMNLFFDYWGEARFRFAWWQAGLGLLVCLTLPFQRRNLRVALGCLAIIGLLALLVQVEISRLFWQVVPLVKFIQFAWRLLGLASFVVAVLTGALVMLPVWRGVWTWVVTLVLIGGLALPATRNLQLTSSSLWYAIGEEEIGPADLFARGRTGFSLFSDYSPRALQVLPWDLSFSRSPDVAVPAPLAQAPGVEITHINYNAMQLAVRAAAPFRLHMHRLYFPGWQVYADGQRVETFPDGAFGLVTADMPTGDYVASIQFDQTRLRQAADLSSIVVLGLWAGTLLFLSFSGRRRRGVAFAPFILFGAIWLVSPWQQAGFTPVANAVNFQDTLHLLGYRLPATEWQAGERIPLRLYWFVQDNLEDYKVFLHLAQLDDSGVVAQFDSAPRLDYSRMSAWNPGEIVDDLYYLNLDDAVPPGRYLLLMGVYQPDPLRNLEVRAAPDTLPGDRVVLGQVDVVEGE